MHLPFFQFFSRLDSQSNVAKRTKAHGKVKEIQAQLEKLQAAQKRSSFVRALGGSS